MRTGYTYDDEMPQSHGSFQNNGRRRPKRFTGTPIGTISVDPVTREMKITPFTDEETAENENNKTGE